MLPQRMSSAASSSSGTPVPQIATGPTVPIPEGLDAHTFLFSSYYRNLPNPHEDSGYPDHTFDGKAVPPARPFLVDTSTGASMTFARAKADSEKVAASLIKVVGSPLSFDEASSREAIHSSRTTLLLHLPNCIAFASIVLGSLRAHCTTTPISSLLAPTEIAYILAKARPQVIVTSKGPQGKGKILEAIDILARAELPNTVTSVPRHLIDAYVDGLRTHLAQNVPLTQRRLRTVDLEADYLGSGFNATGELAAQDPEDWSHLLAATAADIQCLPSGTFSRKQQESRAALLLWSSGTTGLPKGVLLSHRSVISGSLSAWMKPHEAGPFRNGGERWIALAPWCHVFGLGAFFFAGLAQGATILLPPPGRFNLRTFLQMLSTHRATWANIAPTVVVALRNTPLLDPSSSEFLPDLDLTDLKGFMAGGAPVSPDAIVAVHKRLGKYVQMGYGSSETIGTHQGQELGLNSEDPSACKELGSTGVVMANCEIRIEPDQALPPEERLAVHREYEKEAVAKRRRKEFAPTESCIPGEVWVRTPARMMGYYSGIGSDEGDSVIDHSTQPFTADGWYRSGDEGVMDAAGNLWIIGRTKETFKVKGFQVAPVELDSLFATHPAVADAAAGHVFEESEGTDFPIMFVEPTSKDLLRGSDQQAKQEALVRELSEWVRGRAAYYKWPRYYVFTESIPRSPAGKILRKDLNKIEGQRHRAPQAKSRL